MTTSPRIIYWFRTDLRLHDSPALKAALDLNPSVFWPIWLWDPHYVFHARVGVNRWQYLIDCMKDLSSSITRLNDKSKLLVIREAPQTVLPKLFREWRVTHLVYEKDTDAYAKGRDEEVMRLAKEAGVEVVVRSGRTLYDSDRLVEANGRKGTFSITQVQHAGAKIGPIPRPIPPPTSFPDMGETPLDISHDKPPQEPDYNAGARDTTDQSFNSLAGPKGDFAVPTLEELGMKPATTLHRGGETHALQALDAIIAREDYTATFEKPNTAPTDFLPQATTLLSPHLHFGSLSCREFYWRVQDVVDNYKGKASKPPTSLTGQLLFRDMYFGAQAAIGQKFGQAYGNPSCRFIPWHLPSRVDTSNGLITGEYDIDSEEANKQFLRWKYGMTGFPWIDALMRQLRQEGWIHHLGRHAVACFLTRGGCYIDWERGAEVFEEWLIDHEAACNIGNWQWLSCTAFFSQFYRCYSPTAFPAKWDKTGAFVRHYIPELAKYDRKYIYEPWKAPVADQKSWGCVVTGDGGEAGSNGVGVGEQRDGAGWSVYPKPMFEFARERDVCMKGMKMAYQVGLRGNDPRVLDGTWRELFPDDAEGPTKGARGPPGAMLGGDGGRGVGDVSDEVSTAANGTAKAKTGTESRAPSLVERQEQEQQRKEEPPNPRKRTRGAAAAGAAGAAGAGGQMTLEGFGVVVKRPKRGEGRD